MDPVEFKRDTAKTFGATETAASAEEAIPMVQELTAGVMADRVVLTPSVLAAELLANPVIEEFSVHAPESS